MTEKLFPLSDFDTQDIIGVSVCKTSEEGSHVGILYYNSDGEKKFLHLAFHYYLRHDSISDIENKEGYRWVKLCVDEVLLPSIAQTCENVAAREQNQSIPYGLYYRNAKFDADGVLKIDNEVCGLSCSTFVIAILEGAGLSFINFKDWKSRPEDIKAHKQLVEMLEKHKTQFNISDEHIANVKKEITSLRCKPHEIAGAATNETPPSDFNYCENTGKGIYELLPDSQEAEK